VPSCLTLSPCLRMSAAAGRSTLLNFEIVDAGIFRRVLSLLWLMDGPVSAVPLARCEDMQVTSEETHVRKTTCELNHKHIETLILQHHLLINVVLIPRLGCQPRGDRNTRKSFIVHNGTLE
jgi:hypothetical protein